MSNLRFDKEQLMRQLERLSPQLRAAFAAACAQRLLPAYAHFTQRTGREDPNELGWMLERLWDDLEGDPMSAEEVQQSIDRCLSLIPEEEDEATDEPPQSLEEVVAAAQARASVAIPAMETEAWYAAEALAYAFRCRQNGEAQESAWAAECANEAVYKFLTDQEDGVQLRVLSYSEVQAKLERVQSYPLYQAELIRQRQDLDELLSVREEDQAAEVVARLEERAKAEASTVFGTLEP
jgi:uncharacterized protein DUF416